MITKAQPMRLLYLEDSEADFVLALHALRRDGIVAEATRVETLDAFREQLSGPPFQAILADYHLAGFTALDALPLAQQLQPGVPFIIVSGAVGELVAINAIHLGASDYVLKDKLQRLTSALGRAIKASEMQKAKERAEARLKESERLLGELAQHLQTSIEDERASIAREIHDDIGGSLTALKFDLAWIGRRMTEPSLVERVQSALAVIDHALDASQRIMLNLRPAVLDQGLVPALEWLTGNFERRTRIQTHFSCPHEQISASTKVQEVAYRTVQEALTNIVKHAHADSVKVIVSANTGFLSIEVADDGRGFEDTDLNKSHSFGIRGLRERARAIGGWLDVGAVANGASVTLTVPLRTDESRF